MLFKTLAVAALSLASLVNAQNTSFSDLSLTEALNRTGLTSQLLGLIASNPQYTQLFSAIATPPANGTGNYTLFAPSDAALGAALASFASTPNLDVASILQYHVINGSYPTSKLSEGSNIVNTILTNTTYSGFPNGTGLPLNIWKSGYNVSVYYGFDFASVVSADILTRSGIVHIIDKVLIPLQSPSKTIKAGNLNSLYSALNATNLTSVIDGFGGKKGLTIFAPSESAFSGFNSSQYTVNQTTAILSYHVVEGLYFSTNLTTTTNITTLQGNNITISVSAAGVKVIAGNITASLVRTDILTSSGVIHVIDKILIPTAANGTVANQTNITKTGAGNALVHGVDLSITVLIITLASVFATFIL